MRARRHFRPSVDFLPIRLAPCGVTVALDPMDSTTVSTGSTPTLVDPMDPTSSTGNPTTATPTATISGSFVTTPCHSAPC